MNYFTKGIVFLMIITLSMLANAFSYPVGTSSPRDGDEYWDAQDFGTYNDDYNGFHLGEDWNRWSGNMDCGQSIYAISGGFVKEARYFNSDWGNIIIIDHGLIGNKRVESMYAHVDTMYVNQDDIVTWGEQIATMGGNFSGMTCHLHFEIRDEDCPDFGDDGYAYLDPIPNGWFNPSDFIDGHPISATTFWSDTESSMGPWELNDSEYFHVKARIANGGQVASSVYRVVLALHDDDGDWVADLYSTYPITTLYSGGTYLINPPTVVMDTSSFNSGNYQVVVKMQRFYGDYWENLGSRDLRID
jgi:murein DD-endopeptidase MepM/ murein hydrolase activator NlpD